MDPRILITLGVGLAGLALAAYLLYRWNQLKSWASNWLSSHPHCKKVVCDINWVTQECAAAVRRGCDRFHIPVVGVSRSGVRTKVISEEEISIEHVEKLKEKIRKNDVLAVSV